MTATILSIDVGLTSTKALVMTLRGDVLAVAHAPTPTEAGAGGRHEIDGDELWNVVAGCAARAVSDAGPPRVAVIGVTGFGNGLFAIDHDGVAIGPASTSSDVRAVSVVDALEPDARAQIERSTSVSPWPGQPLAQLALLRRDAPDRLGRMAVFGFVKDWLRFKLTGVMVTDRTDAVAGGLGAGGADSRLLDAWGLADYPVRLPEVRDPLTIGGHLTAAAATRIGLPAGIPVAVGLFDCAASVVGGGGVHLGDTTIIAGTWAIAARVSTAAERSDGFMAVPWVSSGQWLRLESAPVAGAALEWVRSIAGGADFSWQRDWAALSGEMGRLRFLPFVSGRPGDTEATAEFTGIEDRHGSGHLMLAALEGVAQYYRHQLDVVSPDSTSIRMLGGATRIPGWPQLVADTVGRTVRVVDEVELGARGAALVSAVAAGLAPTLSAALEGAPVRTVATHPRPCSPRVEALGRAFRAHLL